MTTGGDTRADIAQARRVVVKVGSSSLASAAGGLDAARVDALVDAVAECHAAGREVVVVSSGAIAAGLAPLGLRRRPRDLATLQAAASVGQSRLVQEYARSFTRYATTVAQVLLTAEDVVRRAHYRNARRALERLMHLRVVPIVNENDTVATDEIRFGDNDRLAALVAHLVHADALILLSDVDGLYDRNPAASDARLVSLVRGEHDLPTVTAHVGGSARIGTGGMVSKLDAARVATGAGIPVVLGAAGSVRDALAGRPVGTHFLPTGRRTSSRLLWLAHASTPTGRLRLDAGAVTAVVVRRSSLLPAGVTGVEGDFAAGDPVELVAPDGRPVARGLVGYDAAELPPMLGRSIGDLGPDQQRELVHRDDLVLLP
ncbi:MAG: glutamate 5-kinase [Actinomycetota bacterium]|nr:glutamate 5-kinase [Actinomycetota bacterium]